MVFFGDRVGIAMTGDGDLTVVAHDAPAEAGHDAPAGVGIALGSPEYVRTVFLPGLLASLEAMECPDDASALTGGE